MKTCPDIQKWLQSARMLGDLHEDFRRVLINPQPDQEGNNLQRPNSGFIQHTPHETQYTS